LVLFVPYLDRHPWGVMKDNGLISTTGLIPAFLGFILMNWSVVVLDRQFSTDVTVQDGHRLITGRPYRYIRHPRYLGIIVFLAGISLVFRSWFALCLTAEVLLVLIWCIHDEEKLMHQEFRDEWEQHREKTFSLFPFIY
jgi:protein-S-isoprenylcysteine O-methyltransferase Ste14